MNGRPDRIDGLRPAAAHLRALPAFLRDRAAAEDAARHLERLHHERERSFADLLARAVFGHAPSPYAALFRHLGLGETDVARMLREDGLESTLERLHDAGVFVTLEEFKGRRPICRPGLELRVTASSFDNPLLAGHYETRTGGSGGAARSVRSGLDLIAHEALLHAEFDRARGLAGRRTALWLPAPPGAVGLKCALVRARLGAPIERWFSPTRPSDAPARFRLFAAATRLAALGCGVSIPPPRFTPFPAAAEVARWLAPPAGRPSAAGLLLTTPSAALRVCAAARAAGIDVSGSFFVLFGEPLTPAKTAAIESAGCRAASHYAMVEAGLLGLACAAPEAPDDVHLASSKIAVIGRPRRLAGLGRALPALFHTSLLAATPKVLVNVESGDYGTLVERDCGCRTLPAAYRRHLHSIRSYEKLTSEGMHFLGGELLELLETELPRRFGGGPGDYQLEEREAEDGQTTVALVAHPGVGPLDEAELRRVALEFLGGRGAGQRMMAEVWNRAGTLRIVRAEPTVTGAGKILPLQRARS